MSNPGKLYSDTMIVTELVDSATEEGINWQHCSAICDAVNRTPYSGVEASRALKTRLKLYKRPDVQMAAVELMESLVKNCPHIHITIGSKKYQTSIIKLATNRKLDDGVRESLIVAVQNIAGSFRMLPLEQQHNFVWTHMQLKIKGVNFPPEKDTPAFNPPTLIKAKDANSPTMFKFKLGGPKETVRNNHQSIPKNLPPAMTADEMCKAVAECVEVITEALTACSPAELKDNEIIGEMTESLKNYQRRIVEFITSGSQSEDTMSNLLTSNDTAETVLQLVQQTIKEAGKAPTPAQKPAPTSTPSSPKPVRPTAPQMEEPDLLGNYSPHQSPMKLNPNSRTESSGRLNPPPGSPSHLAGDTTPKSRRRIISNSAMNTSSTSVKQQDQHIHSIPSTLIDLSLPQQQSNSNSQFAPSSPLETSTSFFPPVNFPPSPVTYRNQPQNNQDGFDAIASRNNPATSPFVAPPSPAPVKNLDTLFDELALDAFGPPTPYQAPLPQFSPVPTQTINYPTTSYPSPSPVSYPTSTQYYPTQGGTTTFPTQQPSDGTADLLGLF